MQPKLFKGKVRMVKKAIPADLDFLFISAFGSWNYGLQTKTSDIDFKAVYIPTLDELLHPSEHVISSIIHVGNVGDCEVISIQAFVQRIKELDISKIETLFATNIWINDKHQELFSSIKEYTLDYIISNKVRYIDAVINVCSNIYRTFVTSKVFKYNGKKAYNIPRLKYLLNGVVFSNEYSLIVDDEVTHDRIMAYKVGNVEKEDAEIECRVIMERMESMKETLTDENELMFQERCKRFDELVTNGVYTEIVRATEERRIRKKTNKLTHQCRSDIGFHMTLSFITLWLMLAIMIITVIAR